MALLSRRRNVSCQSLMWVLIARVKWLLVVVAVVVKFYFNRIAVSTKSL